ncbi:hypothetical protein H2200_011779 [Cladophialophora chaetospira]|uniref:Uncharacterized protein n=1 Tax=Cladophialophora chaetospira TaxID=386627 RepID=A0AA39CCU1_9EURO|nr:hypothetical protein H2200_011779 [Cladophialophora chaetospira]
MAKVCSCQHFARQWDHIVNSGNGLDDDIIDVAPGVVDTFLSKAVPTADQSPKKYFKFLVYHFKIKNGRMVKFYHGSGTAASGARGRVQKYLRCLESEEEVTRATLEHLERVTPLRRWIAAMPERLCLECREPLAGGNWKFESIGIVFRIESRTSRFEQPILPSRAISRGLEPASRVCL